MSINQTITFPPNETSILVTVDIIDDGIHEGNETFIGILKISDSTFDNIIINGSTAVGIITDDDELRKHSYVATCCYFTVFIIDVQFLNNINNTFEDNGVILFTVISLVPSDKPFSVQVCTRDIVPQSAEGLFEVLAYFIT